MAARIERRQTSSAAICAARCAGAASAHRRRPADGACDLAIRRFASFSLRRAVVRLRAALGRIAATVMLRNISERKARCAPPSPTSVLQRNICCSRVVPAGACRPRSHSSDEHIAAAGRSAFVGMFQSARVGPSPTPVARTPSFGATRLASEFGKRAHRSYNRQNRTTIRGLPRASRPTRIRTMLRPPAGRPTGGRQWQ